jgi:hypothetical protein
MKTYVGLIPDDEHVAHARAALQAAGVPADGIATLARPAEVWDRLAGHRRLRLVRRHAMIGALLGLAISAIYSVPLIFMYCPETGCSFGTSVSVLAILALYWLLGGAFLGAIAGTDRLEQGLYSYVEGVRRGARLMVVEAPDDKAAAVPPILQHESGLLVYGLERGDKDH